jgi:hypothetical protein
MARRIARTTTSWAAMADPNAPALSVARDLGLDLRPERVALVLGERATVYRLEGTDSWVRPTDSGWATHDPDERLARRLGGWLPLCSLLRAMDCAS